MSARSVPTVAIVSCTRRHAFELGPNLLSLATHAPGVDVHVFSDGPALAAINPCLDHFRQSLKLHLHSIEDLGAPLPDFDPSEPKVRVKRNVRL